MIVADTNLIAYLLLEGHRTRRAETAFERDSAWAAPLPWRSEFRNILAYYCRRGSLSYRQSVQVCQRAEILLKGQEYAVASVSVLALAAQSKYSAYDCEFVALAKRPWRTTRDVGPSDSQGVSIDRCFPRRLCRLRQVIPYRRRRHGESSSIPEPKFLPAGRQPVFARIASAE